MERSARFVLRHRWLPAEVAKLLRVEPSPLRPDAVSPPGYEIEPDALTASSRAYEAVKAETGSHAQVAGTRSRL